MGGSTVYIHVINMATTGIAGYALVATTSQQENTTLPTTK